MKRVLAVAAVLVTCGLAWLAIRLADQPLALPPVPGEVVAYTPPAPQIQAVVLQVAPPPIVKPSPAPVVDSGFALSRLQVSVFRGKTPAVHARVDVGTLSALTDGEGKVSFMLPRGTHTVVAGRPGTEVSDRVEVTAQGQNQVFLRLRHDAWQLEAQVKTSDGQPVAGALVEVTDSSEPTTFRSRTRWDGRIMQWVEGPVLVVVKKTRFIAVRRVAPTSSVVELILQPLVTLTVRIEDEQHRAAEGACLGVLSAIDVQRTCVDRTGIAQVDVVAGAVELRATWQLGASLLAGKVLLDKVPEAPVTILLRPHPGLLGQVFDPHHVPVKGARVLAIEQTLRDPAFLSPTREPSLMDRQLMSFAREQDDLDVVTDNEGRFALKLKSPIPRWRLFVLAPGLRERTAPLWVSFETEPLEIELERLNP